MIDTSLGTKEITQPDPPMLWQVWLWNGFWLVLMAIPPFLIAVQISQYGLQVPLADELLQVPLIIKLHTGGFTFNDFWNQHNEHRIFFWRILSLALAKVGGYSVPKETWAGFGFAVLTLLLVWRLVRLSVAKIWVGTVMVGVSWLLFSTTQWQNWYWGFQAPWFLVNLICVLAVLMLSYRPVKARNFGLAIGLSLLATFTVGTAIPILAAVLAGMVLDWRNWRWKYLLLWAGSGLAALVLYFYKYDPNPVGFVPDKTYFLKHLPETVLFVLRYLGGNIANWGNTEQTGLAGLLLITLIAGSSSWLWWKARRDSSYYQTWVKAWPWLVIALFGIFNGCLSAISRVGLGQGEALDSRYTTISLWVWLAGAMLAGLSVQKSLATISDQKKTRLVKGGLVGVSVVCLISFGFTYASGWQRWQLYGDLVNQTLPFFYDYDTAPPWVLGLLYGSGAPEEVERVRKAAWVLNQYHEGPFQISKAQYQANEDKKWQDQLKDNGYQARVYPGNFMAMTQGDGGSIKLQEDRMTFLHSGPSPTNITIDLAKLNPAINLLTPPKPLLAEIQMKTAEFVEVFFDTGKGFNYGEYTTLDTALEPEGQSIFRLALPPGTKAFRVASMYRVAREQADSLKVIVYTKD